jgi:hypothetical protein
MHITSFSFALQRDAAPLDPLIPLSLSFNWFASLALLRFRLPSLLLILDDPLESDVRQPARKNQIA